MPHDTDVRRDSTSGVSAVCDGAGMELPRPLQLYGLLRATGRRRSAWLLTCFTAGPPSHGEDTGELLGQDRRLLGL
jgi:hypothetical protein